MEPAAPAERIAGRRRHGSIDDDSEVDEAELISVPLLGRRTIGTHQRILFGAAGRWRWSCWPAWPSMRCARPTRSRSRWPAHGDSLMQSQRLAKSVSQALIGSPQAFPDVRDSADVLARSVRGLKDGDDEPAPEAGRRSRCSPTSTRSCR
jgi:twitching motility protein PilJ